MAQFGVIGAGAIGSTVACRLAAAGQDVVLFARGARRDQVTRDGVGVRIGDSLQTARPTIADSGDPVPCDTLFLAVKADALPGLIPAIRAASHAETRIVPLCNGLPWWYRQRGAADAGLAVEAVDPDGRLAAAIDPTHIVGSVLFLRTALGADGIVLSQGDERMMLGNVTAGDDAAAAIAAALDGAGIACSVVPSIRRALWSKVALNLATNPLSAVTRATLADMCADDHLRGIVRAILAETLEVAALDGEAPQQSADDLFAISSKAGPFLTSMAQDAIAGRPLELAAIAQAVLDLGASHGHAMPTARSVAALAAWRHPANRPA